MRKFLNIKSGKKDFSGYLYVLPFFMIVILFWYLPILMSGWFSLTKYNALSTPSFNGLENYKALFQDETFRRCVQNTLVFVITIVPSQTLLGFLIAVWVNKRKTTWLGKFVRNAMFIPSLSSASIVSIVYRILLNNGESPLAMLLSVFGINSTMVLGSQVMVFPALIIIEILMGTGYHMVLYLAYLVDIPESYYEAARIDEASGFQIIRYIIEPLIRPTTILILFLGVIGTFQSFDMVYIMTGGGPGQATTMTIMVYLYLYSFKYSKIGYGMAIGNMLILMVVFLTFLQRRLLNNKTSKLY